jgi:hypothetical protein
LVARSVRVGEVAGSNPVSPIPGRTANGGAQRRTPHHTAPLSPLFAVVRTLSPTQTRRRPARCVGASPRVPSTGVGTLAGQLNRRLSGTPNCRKRRTTPGTARGGDSCGDSRPFTCGSTAQAAEPSPSVWEGSTTSHSRLRLDASVSRRGSQTTGTDDLRERGSISPQTPASLAEEASE